MGLAGGATADDAEAEYIRAITEKEIVTGDWTRSHFLPEKEKGVSVPTVCCPVQKREKFPNLPQVMAPPDAKI